MNYFVASLIAVMKVWFAVYWSLIGQGHRGFICGGGVSDIREGMFVLIVVERVLLFFILFFSSQG